MTETQGQTPLLASLEKQRYYALLERHDAAKSGLDAIETKISALTVKREKAASFFAALKTQEGLLDTFDEKLWLEIGESMTVNSDGSVEVVFKGGAAVMVEATKK